MLRILQCIGIQHDLRLVILAAVICAVSSASAFRAYHSAVASAGRHRIGWLVLTALVAGSGVWSTHFIADLAYQPTLGIRFDVAGTGLSLAAAVGAIGCGFAFAAYGTRPELRTLGGGMAGLGIALMHYLGVAATRMPVETIWNPDYVAASVATGALGAAAALGLAGDCATWRRTALGAALFVLAIVGLHFTSMSAITLIPTRQVEATGLLIDRPFLAVAVSCSAGLLLAIAAALSWVERSTQRNTLFALGEALDAAPSALTFFDRLDRVIFWNSAARAAMAERGLDLTVGQARREVIRHLAQSVGDPTLRRQIRRGLQEPVRVEFPGGDRWWRFECGRTQSGASVVSLTDITDSRRSVAALAEARDQAEAANRAKTEFLANMSHEIRTPLNGVLGMAEALGTTRLSREQRSFLDVVRRSGERLNELLGDLLDLSRIEAGMMPLVPQPVSLADLICSVAAAHEAAAREKGLLINVAIEPEADKRVQADPAALRKILAHLTANAIKFTARGEVALSASWEDGAFKLEVRDTGAGFDPRDADKMFQRFGQADGSSTRRHGGAGLGLALCSELARLMGAKLAWTSTPGQGSTFTLTAAFPACEAPTPPRTLEAAEGDFRVLVVDDNPVNRKVLELILDAAGVAHASASDGAEAVAAFAARPFDAVLMDVQMPVMDGLEATRRIRAHELAAGLARRPILIISASALAHDREAGRAAGADVHLSKPVSAAQVLEALGEFAAAA